MGCYVCVPQDRVSVIETCGAFRKEAGPGFHCLPVPCVYSVAGMVSTRITPLTVHVETKTKDNVFATLVVVVQYRVQQGAVYEQIRSYIYDVIRATVPKMNLDEVFESKQHIARAVLQELRDEMKKYGFEILDALVVDVTPDERVRNSMNEINANKRLRQAAVFKSEALKLQIVKAAEGDAEAQFLHRRAIVEGMKVAVAQFHDDTRVSAKAATDLILVTQYFDTLKDIVRHPGSKAIFFTEDEGTNAELVSSLRQGILQASSAQKKK